MESIGVTCRSKRAKIILFGNPRWPPYQPCWKSMLNFISWTKWAIDSNFNGSIEVTFRLKKKLKSFWLEIQNGRHLENQYWTSSLEPKGQLTQTCLVIRWAIQRRLGPIVHEINFGGFISNILFRALFVNTTSLKYSTGLTTLNIIHIVKVFQKLRYWLPWQPD